jgi:hypothetical protein
VFPAFPAARARVGRSRPQVCRPGSGGCLQGDARPQPALVSLK